MKIVMFGAEFTMTGAGLMLCQWAEHLAAAGHEVSILPKDRTPGPLFERFRAAGVSVVDAAKAYVDNRTLAICSTIEGAAAILQSAAYTRTIWWVHEAESGAHFLRRNPQLSQAFAAADAVIFPTCHLAKSVYRDVLTGLPGQKISIIPYGIDVTAAGQTNQAPPDGPIRVLSVGSLYPRKRHDDLVKAVGSLDDLDLECVLAGRFYCLDEDSMRLVQERPDRYRLVGELPNDQALGLIASAHIFALPSADESMGIVNLEAGVRGKPLVLSDLGCYEGLWRHGHNCLTHPIGDVRLLAHMLRILATDPAMRDHLGAAARRTSLPFSTSQMLSRLDQVIEAVCRQDEFLGQAEKKPSTWTYRLARPAG